jgi:hypothetical protein
MSSALVGQHWGSLSKKKKMLARYVNTLIGCDRCRLAFQIIARHNVYALVVQPPFGLLFQIPISFATALLSS